MYGDRSVALILIGVLLSGCVSEPTLVSEPESTSFPLPPNEYVFYPENIASEGERPEYLSQWWGCYDMREVAPIENPYYYDEDGPDRWYTCASGTVPPEYGEDGWLCYVEDADIQYTPPPAC